MVETEEFAAEGAAVGGPLGFAGINGEGGADGGEQSMLIPSCAEERPPSSFAQRPQANHRSLKKVPQSALAARAACWLAICSFIFCCISLGVGSAMWVATIQV